MALYCLLPRLTIKLIFFCIRPKYNLHLYWVNNYKEGNKTLLDNPGEIDIVYHLQISIWTTRHWCIYTDIYGKSLSRNKKWQIHNLVPMLRGLWWDNISNSLKYNICIHLSDEFYIYKAYSFTYIFIILFQIYLVVWHSMNGSKNVKSYSYGQWKNKSKV